MSAAAGGGAASAARPRRAQGWILVAGLAAVYLQCLHGKLAAYREMRADAERWWAGSVPVAGNDSYLYFRQARESLQGTAPVGRDPLRSFPDGRAPAPSWPLARAMAGVASAWGSDPYRAGIWITMLGAGLFVFPLGLYFQRLGAPLAGLWGAFVGALGTSYGLRTAPHRVDTDGVNLLLLWSVSLLILETGGRRGRLTALATAAAAGLGVQLLCLWYRQPGFALLFGAAFLLHLAAQRVGPAQLARLGALFLLCAGPRNLLDAGRDVRAFAVRYLHAGGVDPAAVVGGLHFPGVLPEIAELRALPFLDALGLAAGETWLGLVGLAGFAVFAARRPRGLLPMLPLLVLAALGLLRFQRFLMYLGPFLGAGCGELLALLLGRARPPLALAAGAAPLVLLVAVLPASQASRPGLSAEFLRSLQRLAPRLPPGSVVAASWSEGYAVSDLAGAATLNDGEDPDPVVEQLLDRGLSDADPAVLHDLLAFLASRGRAGVEAAAGSGSYAELLEAARGADPPADHPVYLLLSDKMLRGFDSIWLKGRWDFAAGRGEPEGYDLRSCHDDGGELVCTRRGGPELRVDPERGLVNGGAPIAAFLRVTPDGIRDERRYVHASPMWLQLVERDAGGGKTLQILKRAVFASNFNQMFVLGRFDPELFRLELDAFPTARLYALLPRPRAPRPGRGIVDNPAPSQ